jgi:NAD(P)H-flavin reductase
MSTEKNSISLLCELSSIFHINNENFILEFNWHHTPVKAGQFFMIQPERSSVFLPRPISIFEYNIEQNYIKFLIVKVGKGTEELSQLQPGEKVRLTGPFGNSWAGFLPENGRAALVGGSAGVAPLAALMAELPEYNFHFFAGFKNGFKNKDEENAMLGSAKKTKKLIITAEDGINALNGRIIDFIFEPESYDVIFGCGSTMMLKALKKKCDSRNVKCFISTESRMACGVGACLGCSVRTINGNRRCCADGPIFSAGDVLFNE